MKNNKLLIVVDMQNDFIDGSLGTKEAQSIVPNVIEKIRSWGGDIIVTQDTHFENYLDTREGNRLPIPHCVEGTDGHKINSEVFDALVNKHFDNGSNFSCINKLTFGSTALPEE